MRRLWIIGVVALPLALGGCGTLNNLGNGFEIVTSSVTNPVTRQREAQVELAIDTAISALNGYKRACAAGTADKPCRANIAAIQRYTRQMDPLLVQLRMFVDRNDQVNATVVYNQLVMLFSNFKAAAKNLGYNVGELP